MPTDPNYEYVERVHKKTEHLASEGWRYGCHSQHVGSGPRGQQTAYRASPWSQSSRWVVTDWKPITCGHDMRSSDDCCKGCENQ